MQADPTVGNQVPALTTAQVPKCSIALHLMPGRIIPLRQAFMVFLVLAFLLPTEYFFYFLSLQRKFSTGLLPYITPGARLLAKKAVICFRDTVITLITVQFLTAKCKQMRKGLKHLGIPTSGCTWCDVAGAEDAAQLGSSSKLWSLGTQTCSYLWIAGIKLPLGHKFKAKERKIWHRL